MQQGSSGIAPWEAGRIGLAQIVLCTSYLAPLSTRGRASRIPFPGGSLGTRVKHWQDKVESGF